MEPNDDDGRLSRGKVEELTVTQLRAKLKSMKLPVYGCKRTLCQRLMMTASPQMIPDSVSSFSQSTFPLFNSPQSQRQSFMDDATHSSIAECKLVELRERCKEVGLPSSGRKQELVDRLEAYYEKALLADLIEPSCSAGADQEFLDWDKSNSSELPLTLEGRSSQRVNGSKSNHGQIADFEPEPFIDSTSVSRFQNSSPNFSNNVNIWAGCPKQVTQRDLNPLNVRSREELEKYTLPELREMCKSLNLPVSGKKAEVCERLAQVLSIMRTSSMYSPSQQRQGGAESLIFHPPPGPDEIGVLTRRKRMKKQDDTMQSLTLILPNEAQELSQIDNCRLGIEPGIKNRLRSSSRCSETEIKLEVNIRKKTINDRIEEPLTQRFCLFSESFDERRNCWKLSILAENDRDAHCVKLETVPSCDCSDFLSEKMACKHILFVYLRVLKMETNDPILTAQILSVNERDIIFKKLKSTFDVRNGKSNIKKRITTRSAPVEDTDVCEVVRENWADKVCGLCFEFLGSNEPMAWCRVLCGKNVHISCYERWEQQRQEEQKACPYCLSIWNFVPKNTRFQSKLKRIRIGSIDP